MVRLAASRLSYGGSELSWVDDGSSSGHVEVAGVSGRWPGSDAGAGVGGFWDAWRTPQDLPQVPPPAPVPLRTALVMIRCCAGTTSPNVEKGSR